MACAGPPGQAGRAWRGPLLNQINSLLIPDMGRIAGVTRTETRVLAEMLAADPGRPVTELLLQAGRCLPRHRDACSYLVVEALIAARRDDEVAGPVREY